MIKINYALQVCDVASNQSNPRYCSDSKTEVTIKCVTSFLRSVEYAAKNNADALHTVMIFDDKSSQEVVDFLQRAKQVFHKENVHIIVQRINSTGIMDSIRTCWEWLRDQESDLVYQVQDDYLYTEDAIFQMISMFMQIYNDLKTQPIIVPYHNSLHWRTQYFYRSTPRLITPGRSQYWLQCYDIPCTFMTGKPQFINHWDIYEKFLALNPKGNETGSGLEDISLNRILVDRQVLGLMPFTSLALHMQHEYEKDPFIDWKERWDSIPTV